MITNINRFNFKSSAICSFKDFVDYVEHNKHLSLKELREKESILNDNLKRQGLQEFYLYKLFEKLEELEKIPEFEEFIDDSTLDSKSEFGKRLLERQYPKNVGWVADKKAFIRKEICKVAQEISNSYKFLLREYVKDENPLRYLIEMREAFKDDKEYHEALIKDRKLRDNNPQSKIVRKKNNNNN